MRVVKWENWNEIEKEVLNKEGDDNTDGGDLFVEETDNSAFKIPENDSHMVYTPFGVFPKKSSLKPSCRWECWLGHTNFRILKSDLDILSSKIDGVAGLNQLDPYTFCIGIAKSFNFTNVREQIEERICSKS